MASAYGDFEKEARKWVSVSKEHDLELRYNHAQVRGKNASDVLLAVDATETLFTKPNVDTYAIVAQDSDFAPLARRLRQHGKIVLGFGNRLAARAFVKRCDEFIVIEAKQEYAGLPKAVPLVWPEHQEGAATANVARSQTPERPRKDDEAVDEDEEAKYTRKLVRQSLRQLAELSASGDDWVDADRLLNFVTRLKPDFSAALRGVRWSEYLKQLSKVEVYYAQSGRYWNIWVRRCEKGKEMVSREDRWETRRSLNGKGGPAEPAAATPLKRPHADPGDSSKRRKIE